MKRDELEAMLRCSEEWCDFWEKRALAAEKAKALVAESYEIPVPPSYRR